jgi:hypothetical protein
MIKRISMIFIVFYLGSCSSEPEWKGGIITEAGVYDNGMLKVVVKDQDYALSYLMVRSNRDTLFCSDREFSSFHRWALHLDNENNLWIFSSDIGHACWKKDLTHETYNKQEYFGPISKDSIPADVYNTLKYFPFSINESKQ